MVLMLCLVFGLAATAGTGDPGDQAGTADGTAQAIPIPAARQADRVAVITMEGAIDSITAISIKRRIAKAEAAGMDAMVIEIDSPGGELGAVLEISNAIKESSITNSVAWIHPDAYSGGAIVGLACQEIVHSRPSSFGDAFVIHMGMMGIQALAPAERTKLLPPLMADVTDSARRSGFDEYLVQAIVVDGIELWLVEDSTTGHRMAINEEEYRLLFGDEVIRGKPMLAAVTGGVHTYLDPGVNTPSENPTDENKAQDETDVDPDQGSADLQKNQEDHQEVAPDPNAYQPASPTLRDVEQAMAQRGVHETEQVEWLENPSNRHVITSADRGRYRLVGYITDGSSAIVMRDEQLDYFGFSSGTIQNDEELKAFFGAKEMVRVRMSPSEKAIRVLTSWPVRFVLIAVFLVAMFAEMMTAGTGIAGGISVAALALLIGPGALIGLTGWWVVIAIVAGLICLAIELFVTPGVGAFGVIGFILLFGGLLGTFVEAGSSLSDPQVKQDLMHGAVTVMLGFITAGIGWWLIIKNAHQLPFFEKFILTGASGVGGMPAKSMFHAIVPDDGQIRVGSEGVTTTPLRPIGQGEFGDELVDIYASLGTIEAGERVRVVSATKMRIEVERIEDPEANTDLEAEHPTEESS